MPPKWNVAVTGKFLKIMLYFLLPTQMYKLDNIKYFEETLELHSLAFTSKTIIGSWKINKIKDFTKLFSFWVHRLRPSSDNLSYVGRLMSGLEPATSMETNFGEFTLRIK